MRAALLAMLCLPAAAIAAPNWLSAGNGPENTRASTTEHMLSPATVAGLKPVWTLHTAGDVPATPTLDGNNLYAVDNGGTVWRVDARTGTPIWHEALSAITGNASSVSRNSPAIGPTQIVLGDQAAAAVYALDKNTGKRLWTVTLDKSKGAIITASPVIVGSQVLLGVSSLQEELAATIKGFVVDFRGSVVALDLDTGAVQWQFYTVPEGFTGGAVWGSNLAVDAARHAVYAGTGDNYSVPAAVAKCQIRARNVRQEAACLPADDHIDSVVALDTRSGKRIWTRRMTAGDTWTVSCLPGRRPPGTPCPQPEGLDYDFGSGPNLFTLPGSAGRAAVGAGQKSGVYWALDRDTGGVIWATQVSPGGSRGGIEWGSAVDGTRIFTAASNSNYTWTGLNGGQLTDGGYWTALDAGTGQILWQTPTTAKQPKPAKQTGRTINPPPGAFARTEGAVSAAHGVMYGADAAGNFFALDERTGKVLWRYDAFGAAIDAPAIVDGRLYWGDGYVDIGRGRHALIAFGLK